MTELYRVSDNDRGWALEFKEHSHCRGTVAANPYDSGNCKEILLRPGQTLTHDVMLTYSNAKSIWNFVPPENGRIRWHILPPVEKTTIIGGRYVFVNFFAIVWIEKNWEALLDSNHRDHAAVTKSATSMAHQEVILPAQQRLTIVNVSYDERTKYHYVIARQVEG
eukprot:SAG31_NODE_6124_length_2158_cov_1.932977_2_plen_165_part_00